MLLVVALLAGCASTAAPTDSIAPTPTDTTTPFTAVQAGDCFDEVDGDSVEIVDCESTHGYEVFASLLVADGDYDRTAIGAEAKARCLASFGTFVGIEYDASVLALRYVAPSRDTWDQGDREVLCLVFDPEGPTEGSLAGAAR